MILGIISSKGEIGSWRRELFDMKADLEEVEDEDTTITARGEKKRKILKRRIGELT